ncbi:glycosyltransferase family 4 protein [Luteimonas sp. FXH3W]|uniref:Glycosyltransferase family 4 protein n=1 Tax=Aquilutibacter rugosus TaxID=3115820 RepID=A0ABU7UVZ9_9GAMM
MRVLWVSNTLFPDIAKRHGLPEPVFGGWMYGAAKALSAVPGVELSVAALHDGPTMIGETIDGIEYHLISRRVGLDQQWRRIVDASRPDLVHVHGTEFVHGLALIKLFPEIPSVVSIQGLVSVCARYYLAGMSFWEVVRNITLRDLLRMDTLFQQQQKMAKRGKAEREYIARATAIMGRTDWDRAHVEALRPNAPYVHCDEMLRDEFYGDRRWSYKDCNPRSIFVSQAGYPIKGLHLLIKAAVIARRTYPDLEIRVAGPDITSVSSLRLRIRRGGYGKYLSRLIKRSGMQDAVKFLGALDATQMRNEFLRCNVSVSPSAIENSSNSIAEAQMLGVPVIASQVGGIRTMTLNGALAETYRFDEMEVLASRIVESFARVDVERVEAARQEAMRRHERGAIVRVMTSTYLELVGRDNA